MPSADFWLLNLYFVMLVFMKGLTDTHAHICDPVFDTDRAIVLEKARQAGISRIVAVSENLADAEKNLVLADEYSMLRPAAGLYPTTLDLDQASKRIGGIKALF
jgi:TatD DNase family protein